MSAGCLTDVLGPRGWHKAFVHGVGAHKHPCFTRLWWSLLSTPVAPGCVQREITLSKDKILCRCTWIPFQLSWYLAMFLPIRIWHFRSGNYFTKPSLSSWFTANINGLRHRCFIAEFSAGLLLDFRNEFQPAYLFIYLIYPLTYFKQS